MAFIICYMMYLLKWAVSNTYKSLSFLYNDIVCNLYFKIVLILFLLEAGDIEMNPDPYTSNNSLLMLHVRNVSNIRNTFRLYNRKVIRF